MKATFVTVPAVCAVLSIAAAPTDAVRIADRVSRAQVSEKVGPSDISQTVNDMSAAIYGLIADNPAVPVKYPVAGGDPTVFVGGIGRNSQRLCIRITRAQGGYSAMFSAVVPNGSGPAAIPFDSSPIARARLAADRPGSLEMAIHATLQERGRCSFTGAAPLLPSSWNSTTDKKFTLLVGGAATGKPSTRIAGGDLQPCRLISQVMQRSDLSAGIYAYSCQLQLPTDGCVTAKPVKVLWFLGSRLTGTADISVKSPCLN